MALEDTHGRETGVEVNDEKHDPLHLSDFIMTRCKK